MANYLKEIKQVPHFYIIRSAEHRLLRDYLDKGKKPFLDLGCGDGKFCELLKLDDVYGIDIDKTALKAAERNGCYNKVFHASSKDIPFQESFFSTVFSNCAIEHMDGLDEVLKEVRRVLKTGGEFVFTAPSKKFVEVVKNDPVLKEAGLNGEKAIEEYNKFHHHVNILDLKEWESRLERAGFKIKEREDYLPGPIGGFVMRMDMLYTIKNTETQRLVRKLENRYRFLFEIRLRSFVKRYLENPRNCGSGTHFICKAVKI